MEIVREIVGSGPNGRRPDKARLKRVAKELDRLGRMLLEHMHYRQTAPSAKNLETQLEQLETLAQKQSKILAQLPPFMRELLDATYQAQRTWCPDTKRCRAIDLGSAPIEQAAACILAAARQQLKSWRDETTVGMASPTLRGPMLSYQRLVGDPRAFIVDQVTKLVIREQGAAAASAEEHRPVYTAVIRLWEWSTGLPEKGAHLRKYIRENVRSALIETELFSIDQAIEAEVSRYHASLADFMNAKAKHEYNLRIEELRELRAEKSALLVSKPKRKRHSPAK